MLMASMRHQYREGEPETEHQQWVRRFARAWKREVAIEEQATQQRLAREKAEASRTWFFVLTIVAFSGTVLLVLWLMRH
jgi:hypothetical protein